MDTGKILLGIALVMFSGALMVNPSGAAEYSTNPQVGSGSEVCLAGTSTVDDSLSTLQVLGMDPTDSGPVLDRCGDSGCTTFL